MKLDKNSRVYINCRTQDEQDMMLDIFKCLGLTWQSGRSPRDTRQFTPPMRFFISDYIYHGHSCLSQREIRDGGSVMEARDFVNQWKSLKMGVDKYSDMW